MPPLFDIAETSGFYAQMSAVLAGFAFTAIVVLQTHPRTRGGPILLGFLTAFVALLLAALTYSVLAGETITNARK
ncbi:hypothetical protein AB0J74_01690 [Asanoa sp. NPDC049573]|uniref:hypothetical protein n=1 Tax=Asanoa sp. NPDC049573 TaxID=3155396 RepID=UPI00342F628A